MCKEIVEETSLDGLTKGDSSDVKDFLELLGAYRE